MPRPSERAFALLRRYSNTLNVRLHDIADEVVSRRALPGLDEADTPVPASNMTA